jgi:hypothetical protein
MELRDIASMITVNPFSYSCAGPKEAKARETARLQNIWEATLQVPEGNKRSFKPKATKVR